VAKNQTTSFPNALKVYKAGLYFLANPQKNLLDIPAKQ